MEAAGWSAARRRIGARRIDARRIDVAVAAVLLAATGTELAVRTPVPGQSATSVLAYLLAAGMAAPYAFHRDHPAVATGACIAALLAYSAGAYVAFPGYPVFALVFAVALRTGRRTGMVAAGAALAGLLAALAMQPAAVVVASTWVITALATVLAWALGENLRMRRARWAALEERARRLEAEREERTRQAVLAERLRIARDLHDVIAHALSTIAVQAGVAHHVVDTRPELARQTLASVESASRSALVEVRRLMGVLRQGGSDAGSLAPAPGLRDLPALAGRMREAGLEVAVREQGRPRPLPAGVDLSAYRIVQEALTNVLRHGGPRAEVSLDHTARDLGLRVVDPGRPGGDGPPGDGNGLLGMRERVALFGGSLQAGPAPGGGFVVDARIPLPGAAGSLEAE